MPRGIPNKPRTARVEGEGVISEPAAKKLADPVPGNNGEALARIMTYFQQAHSDEWEALRLCPLQHGIDTMIEKLKH